MPVARMAVQFHSGEDSNEADGAGDWMPTGKSDFDSRMKRAFQNSSGTSIDVLIPNTAWSQVWSINWGVERDYGGINSSGGPQHSGRCEHRLISIERESDMTSPALFKRCCNGMQLKRVFIYDPDYTTDNATGSGIIILAEDAHVVSFQSFIQKSATQRHTVSSTGMGQGDQYFATTSSASQSLGSTSRFDRLSILYTKLSFSVLGADFQGWDTGTEQSFNDGTTII